MLRVIELFGGIGAFSSALDRLKKDYEIVDYVDKDSAAVQSWRLMGFTDEEFAAAEYVSTNS